MANNKGQMSNEVFEKLIKEDYWIAHMATPVNCCDKGGRHTHWRTCSYPDEYIINEEQIKVAKREYKRRHDEELANIKQGDLCFVAMGMDFNPTMEGEVGNHRMRAEFKNRSGRRFFIEFTLCMDNKNFYVDFSIDRDLQAQREREAKEHYEAQKLLPRNKQTWHEDPQDYYDAMDVTRSTLVAATWDAVLDFVNKTYGCDYKRTKLFRNFVCCEEYVCYC